MKTAKGNANYSLFEVENKLLEIEIYTDGACKGNPGRGSWAAILIDGSGDSKNREISGVVEHTTNNQMELKAVVEALRLLKKPCRVKIFSDSAYVVNAFRQDWIGKWQSNGWRTKDRQDVKNRELWEALISQCRRLQVSFEKVAGHSGNDLNERVDRLANQALE